jgi:hypothetical protein
VGIPAAVRERLQRLGLLERRQILPLEVLDERDLDDLVVVDLADDNRDLAQPDLDRGLVAALAGDDLEPMMGSMIPFSAIDAISSERSPMTWRGWFGFGSIWSMGIIRPIGLPAELVSAST